MPHRFWKEIHLASLAHNFNEWRSVLPSSIHHSIGVVKADAYGHGAFEVAKVLLKEGVSVLAVANIHEALELIERGVRAPILVFGDPLPGEEVFFTQHRGLQATVSSLSTLKRLEQVAYKNSCTIDCQLKVDTGMGRQGVWHEEAMELFSQLLSSKNIVLKGIFTHLSAAHINWEHSVQQREIFNKFLQLIPRDIFNERPLRKLPMGDEVLGTSGVEDWSVLNAHEDLSTKVRTQFAPIGQFPERSNLQIHTDNSPGILQGLQDKFLNTARVGSLLYGRSYDAPWVKPLDLKPVLSFCAKVFLVKVVPAETLVGYGAYNRLGRSSCLAIVSAGYAHGLPRVFQGGYALIRGKRCPILNPVSMDQCIVDVTDVKDFVTEGDTAVFLGSQGEEVISINEFAKTTFDHPLEAFCRLKGPHVFNTF